MKDGLIEAKIKTYFESLAPEKLGVRLKIKVKKISKLGVGANNSNYLATLKDGSKFVFRLNILLKSRNKSRNEFNSLKTVEKLDIGPKAWILDDSRRFFDSDFIILEYIEGKSLDKIDYKINNKLISEIVNLCVNFHSMKINKELLKLPKDEINYKDILKSIKDRYKKLASRNIDKELLDILKESFDLLEKKTLKYKHKHPIVLTQGDICEQNIVVHKGNLKLIDFEGMGLTEPASDIAYILTQFGENEINEYYRNIFLDKYLKLIKDPNLKDRVKIFIPLKNFSDLLWAISHVLKIKNKEVYRDYLEDKNIRDDINYAAKVWKRCIQDGTINRIHEEFNIKEVLR